jgi:hypothetical protein
MIKESKQSMDDQGDAEQDSSEEQAPQGLHDDTITMLFLLFERSKGQESKWADWFGMLPRTMANLVCSDQDWSEHVQGTPTWSVVGMERTLLFETYQTLFPLLAEK